MKWKAWGLLQCLDNLLLRTYFDCTYSEAGTCKIIGLLLSPQNDIDSPLSIHFSRTSCHEPGCRMVKR